MKKIISLILALVLMAPALVYAEADTKSVEELEERIAELEAMVEELTEGKEAEQQDKDISVNDLAVGDEFTMMDGVTISVTDYEFADYLTYYSRQNDYSDFFGFSPFFGGSNRYGQRTIRPDSGDVYLCLQVHIDNMSQSDITVADLMNVLVGCAGESVQPEETFLYYTSSYGGYVASDLTLEIGPRVSVDAMLLFMVPEEATDDSTTLDVTFRTENGEAYQYALQAGESGLLMDRYTQN